MARRRRRHKKNYNALLLLIGVVFLGGAVLSWARRFFAAHATAIVVIVVITVVLLALAAALVIRAHIEQAARQAERDRNIAVTDGMTGTQFEQYVARLMRRDGLRHVRVCGGSGDLGADITAYTSDGRKVVVQCKRYAGSVGDPHVQKFNGTAWQIHGANVALLVTTGRPTAKARQLAQRCGIVLVDRDALGAWATHGILPPAIAAPSRPSRGVVPGSAQQLQLDPETP